MDLQELICLKAVPSLPARQRFPSNAAKTRVYNNRENSHGSWHCLHSTASFASTKSPTEISSLHNWVVAETISDSLFRMEAAHVSSSRSRPLWSSPLTIPPFQAATWYVLLTKAWKHCLMRLSIYELPMETRSSLHLHTKGFCKRNTSSLWKRDKWLQCHIGNIISAHSILLSQVCTCRGNVARLPSFSPAW